MLNEKEVKYNVASLVSTWLCGTKDVSNLRLIMSKGDVKITIRCNNAEDASKQLSNALLNNKDYYLKATLVGIVDKEDYVFGELDIV